MLQDISETSCERSDQLNGNAGTSWGDVPHVHQTRNSQDTKTKEQYLVFNITPQKFRYSRGEKSVIFLVSRSLIQNITTLGPAVSGPPTG